MKLAPCEDRIYSQDLVKVFVKRAIDKVGQLGWEYLSHDMKSALIAQQALSVVIGNARNEIPCSAIHRLHVDMLTIAGLLQD
jgi:hypothetical protein